MITTIVFSLLISTAFCDFPDAVTKGKTWVDAKVPYCQAANGAHDADSSCSSTCTRPKVPAWDAYRSDCSGFVSFCWGLPAPGLNTAGFGSASNSIQCSDLQPGDAIVRPGVHIIMFVSWNVMGSSGTFYEEPGCSANPNYAHAFTSSVSISGSQVTVGGATYNCIRSNGAMAGNSTSPSPMAGPSGPSGPSPGGNPSGSNPSSSGSGNPSSSGSGNPSSSGSGNPSSSGSGNPSSSGSGTMKMGGSKQKSGSGPSSMSPSSGSPSGNGPSPNGSPSSSTGKGGMKSMSSSSPNGAPSMNSPNGAPSMNSPNGAPSMNSPNGAPSMGGNTNNWNSNNSPSSMMLMMMMMFSSPDASPQSPANPPPAPAPASPGNAPAPFADASNTNGADSGNTNNMFQAPANPPPAPAGGAPPPAPAPDDGTMETDVKWVGGTGESAFDYFDIVSSHTPSPAKPTWKTYGKCASVPGVCQDIKNACGLSYVSFQCPHVSVPNVRCCPTEQMHDIGLDGIKWRLLPGPVISQSACATTKNLLFPLAPGSLQHISVNFGGNRENGKRCHAGIDLFTHNAKKVVAMADGVVTNVIDNFVVCKCTGKPMQAGAVLVYHPSIGQTVNYGEMSTASIAVQKGATIAQGQFIGTADACCLLHIEMYNGTHTTPLHWLPDTANKKTSYDPDGCTHNSLHVKPVQLLDPRPVINCIKPAGASLLQDAGVGGEQVAPATPPVASHKTIAGGVIAAIVIVGVLVLLAIAVCVVCLIRRQRDETSTEGELTVTNAMFDPNAHLKTSSADDTMLSARANTVTAAPYSSAMGGATMSEGTMLRRPAGTVMAPGGHADEPAGSFPCETCGNMYQYTSDREQHRLLRHA